MIPLALSLAVTVLGAALPPLAALLYDLTQPSLAEQLWRNRVALDLIRRWP